MEFYKRTIKTSDFKKVVDTGQPELPYLLDEKVSLRIFLTQNIEDIGFYEDYKTENRNINFNGGLNFTTITGHTKM